MGKGLWLYCGGASWSLAPYGHRNCLLASIRDSRDTYHIDNKRTFYPTCLWVLPFYCCYAFPIVQPAFWPTFIPFIPLGGGCMPQNVARAPPPKILRPAPRG